MSTDSLALFRKSIGPDLHALAEQHLEHDLQPSDRDALRGAANTLSTHATVGSLLGLGLGVFCAYRLRRFRSATFAAFKARAKPVALKYADGREEAIPDAVNAVRGPSAVGDVVTYALLGAGGLFFGGETGLMTGGLRARGMVWGDREARERILGAWRAFQADALRREAEAVEKGERGVRF